MVYHVLSLGAGVNSTALIHVLIDRGYPLDEVIFADTGAERTATYAYIEKRIRPFLASEEIPFTVVKNKGGTLLERCMKGQYLPDRQYRWQTRDFKIRPIHQYLRQKVGLKGRALCYVGIAWDEIERVKQNWVECLTCGKVHKRWVCGVCGKNHTRKARKGEARDEPSSYGHKFDRKEVVYDHQPDIWLVNQWPLVDHRITRQGCENIIQKHGWDVPPKSGCFFCPLQPLSQWYLTWKYETQNWDLALKLEKNSKIYPVFTLVDGGLEALSDRFEAEDIYRRDYEAVNGKQQQLIMLEENPEDCGGPCFT